MLNRSGERRLSYLDPDLMGKESGLSTTKYDGDFFVDVFYEVDKYHFFS